MSALATVALLAAAACSTPTPTTPAATPVAATSTSPPAPADAPAPTATPSVVAAVPSKAAPTSRPAASAALIQAAFGSLSKTLHPYPDGASYTQAWIDVDRLIWGGADGGGGLLAFDWEALDYLPAMAVALPTVSPDNKTFTFTLRDNVRWSNGAAVTAEDFQFAFDQASREDNRYVQLELLQEIATYRTPDPRTIEITLKDARPRDVALSVTNVIGPVPKQVWSGRSWTDPATNPEILHPSVVLGPFKPEDVVSPDHAAFVPVDTYYAGTPRVPRVEILGSAQTSGAFDALTHGRANWVHSLPAGQYRDAKSDPGLDVKEWAAANATYRTLEFNITRPLLSDKRVRQALAYGVNRADLIQAAEQSLAVPQYGFIQPTNERWVNPALAAYDFDMAKARQLLAESGYVLKGDRLVDKDGQAVKLQVVYPTSSGARAAIAAYLHEQYRQLGIEVQPAGLDFATYTDQVQTRRDFDISLAAYGGGSLDPDLGPKAQLLSNGSQNVTGYSNPQVDALFKQAAVELDGAKRKQLYDQIQVLVNAEVPSHYLYALKAVDVFSRKVQGVTAHKGDRLDANDALLSWSVLP